ncbi:cyclic-AMP response element binding protein B isoform X2 [Leptinotarsa decemlineata]|uniref:cyclic-AMP response element binding protein B isoform X2 n=1 Tax=Leptinotarsa decemlineata TaxID=7539 RepID=UPI000C2556B7|nr:cyclic AMP-dependent transcription factor ATF-1 isoform X2 [Leptinotarsa decemlineata]
METIVEEKCQVDPLAPSPDPQGGIASVGVNNSQPHLVTATNIVQLTLPSHTQAQVQSVIQPNQQSVIQTAANLQPMLSKGNVILVSSKPNSVIHTTQGSLQTLRVVEAGSDDSFSEEESPKKRRDLLTRRPSYRKILNDLGGEGKVEQTSSEADSELSSHSIPYHTVLPATALQITSGDGGQGIQTLTMTNATAGGAIVQYAQGQEFFVPGKDVSLFIDSYPEVKSESPENSEFPVRFKSSPGSPDSYSYSPVVAQSGNISGGGGEDQARKREMRLLKNREAARECRRKKKEYIKCLENRVAVLENQNQTLIEELKSLKELYCQQKTE